jgi:hemoglobin
MSTMEPSVFERVGGAAFFERLVDRFYDNVEADPVLLALYPEPDDLGPARWRLTWFLIQYFGGPTTYSDDRGHPRLRLRHAPYVIGLRERDHWLEAMTDAVDSLDLGGDDREALMTYFDMAADAMRNS